MFIHNQLENHLNFLASYHYPKNPQIVLFFISDHPLSILIMKTSTTSFNKFGTAVVPQKISIFAR